MQRPGFPFSQYLYVVVGIVISVVLPLLRKLLPSISLYVTLGAVDSKTYLAVGAFSLLTAVLVVAFGGEQVANWKWHTAILAGYAWDSTLQKIIHG